jgi:AcrR family transcriptional regulator
LSRPTKTDVVNDFRRAQILDAARASFAKHGLAATTVDQIARAAKLAKGTVYLYYRSKDDIVRDALEAGLNTLDAATLPAITEAAPVEERLRRFLAGMLGHFDENREFFELCQLEFGATMRRRARQAFGRVYAAQVEAWTVALSDGRDEPTAAALGRHIVAFAHGLALQRVRGWTTASLAEDIERGSQLLAKGLRLP